jgi:hypothetical protein
MFAMSDDHKLLATIYGQVAALCAIPVLQPRTPCSGWQAFYVTNGLNFSSSRQDAESLRRLVVDGHLTTSGMTQGKSFRLTRLGVVTGASFAGTSEQAIRDRLEQIVSLQHNSAITYPNTEQQLVMGYQLTPGAGAWWTDAGKTRTAWLAYTLELCRTLGTVTPLQMLGAVQLMPSAGPAWAVHTTDAGRELLDAWKPTVEAIEDAHLADSVCGGFDEGMDRFTRSAPTRFAGAVGRRIPASGWTERGQK